MLAGVLCRPRPERRNESATTKRVKLVTMMSRPGATDSTVSKATSWMIRAAVLPPPCGNQGAEIGVCASAALVQHDKKSRGQKQPFHCTTTD